MSAMFWVKFDNGDLVCVSSADAKSLIKQANLVLAKRKAIKKAKAKQAKSGRPSKAVSCRCVG
jgi:hypothetical protein